MKGKKKTLFNILFLILVFVLTIIGVFHGEDLPGLINAIKGCNIGYIICAIACVVVFVYAESYIIRYMFNSLGIHHSAWKCWLYSCAGFFFSAITPSASGGQPMQMYYMKRENVPITLSSMVLMEVTVAYKAVLVVVGFVVLLFGKHLINMYLGGFVFLFYLGIVLNIGCVAVLLLLMFRTSIAEAIAKKTFAFLEKIHIMKPNPNRADRIDNAMERYRDTAKYLRGHTKINVVVFIITFLQRFVMFAVTYFTYKALRLSGKSFIDIIFLQAIISLSIDMLPFPGGMGIYESMFLGIFKPFFGGLTLAGMVISRGVSYYVQLFMCGIFLLIAHFTLGREFTLKNKSELKEQRGKE